MLKAPEPPNNLNLSKSSALFCECLFFDPDLPQRRLDSDGVEASCDSGPVKSFQVELFQPADRVSIVHPLSFGATDPARFRCRQ